MDVAGLRGDHRRRRSSLCAVARVLHRHGCAARRARARWSPHRLVQLITADGRQDEGRDGSARKHRGKGGAPHGPLSVTREDRSSQASMRARRASACRPRTNPPSAAPTARRTSLRSGLADADRAGCSFPFDSSRSRSRCVPLGRRSRSSRRRRDDRSCPRDRTDHVAAAA